MSDLIERLRAAGWTGRNSLPDMAADEIERLTTEAPCAAHNAAEYHDIIRGQRKRIAELEAALRGYVKATTGQESATVTFPMALEGEGK